MKQPPTKISLKLSRAMFLITVRLTIISLVLLFFATQLTHWVGWDFYEVYKLDSRSLLVVIVTLFLSIAFITALAFFINSNWCHVTTGKWLISLVIAWVIYAIIINIVPYPPLYYEPIINAFDQSEKNNITRIEIRTSNNPYDFTTEGSRLVLVINEPTQINKIIEFINIRESEWENGCPSNCFSRDLSAFLYSGAHYSGTFDIHQNFISARAPSVWGTPYPYSKQFSNDEMTRLKQLIGIPIESKVYN